MNKLVENIHKEELFHVSAATLIKKETQFSSYIRKFKWDRVQKSYMRKGFLI
jgi:hypothetical protein